MSKAHIVFMDECIKKAKKTLEGVERNKTLPSLPYKDELMPEHYNLCGIVMRAIDAMTEEEFDKVMWPIRFARKSIDAHKPDMVEWDNKNEIYRRVKTFTDAKDNFLNQTVQEDSSVVSD